MNPLPAVLAVCLAACLVLAGCVTAPNSGRHADGTDSTLPPPEGCPGHWHFMLVVYLHNETLPFDNESFLRPGPTELHWDTGSLVHVHPHISIPRCVPLRESLATLDLAIGNGTLTLGPKHDEHAGDHSEEGRTRLVVLYEAPGENWRRLTGSSYLGQQLPNGARLMISFGATTDADLAWQSDQVPPIPERYRPR